MGNFKIITTILILLLVLFFSISIFFGDSGTLQGALGQLNVVVQRTFGLTESASSVINKDVDLGFRKMYEELISETGKDTKECLINSYMPLMWSRSSFSFEQVKEGVKISLYTDEMELAVADVIPGMQLCAIWGESAVTSFENLYIKKTGAAGKQFTSVNKITVGASGYTIDGEDANGASFYFYKYDKNNICVIPSEDGFWFYNNYQGLKSEYVDQINDLKTKLIEC